MSMVVIRSLAGVLRLRPMHSVWARRYSARAVSAAASGPGIPNRVWSAHEDDTLRAALEEGRKCKQCAELLPGRTVIAIYNRISYHKHHSKRHSRKPKSSDTIDIIRLARQGLDKHEIHKRMPHRSMPYIITSAYSHGIYFPRKQRVIARKWSADEDQLLLSEQGQHNTPEFGGKSLATINRRRKYLKLAGPTANFPKRPWTAEDVQSAFDKYTIGMSFLDIAISLGRSLGAVQSKVYKECRRLHGNRTDHRNSRH